MTELQPGLYEVISAVNIRREPRILPLNVVGALSVGTQRTVYSIVTDEKNQTWGRVSFADAAGVAQWICMKSLNRDYVKLVTGDAPLPPESPSIDERLHRLEAFARTLGYKG